jgi:hypothetical protein
LAATAAQRLMVEAGAAAQLVQQVMVEMVLVRTQLPQYQLMRHQILMQVVAAAREVQLG